MIHLWVKSGRLLNREHPTTDTMPRHLHDPSHPAQPLLRKPLISVRMQEHHSKHGALQGKAATTSAMSYLLQELWLL